MFLLFLFSVSLYQDTLGASIGWSMFFFFFWPRWVFVAAHGLSLVVASGGLLFVAVRGLLIVVASLVAEHGL